MVAHLHDTFPFLLNRISATVVDAVTPTFQTMGLNVYAARVLILLHLDGDHTVGRLAQQAALEQSTLSHILRRLDRQRLVKRARQKQDNRSVLVSLTTEGRAAAVACWRAVRRHDARLRAGLDAQSTAQLRLLLERIYANVPSFGEPDGRRGARPPK